MSLMTAERADVTQFKCQRLSCHVETDRRLNCDSGSHVRLHLLSQLSQDGPVITVILHKKVYCLRMQLSVD